MLFDRFAAVTGHRRSRDEIEMSTMTDNKHWAEHTEELARLVGQQPFGVVTDIDGTISPIAPTPQEATVTEGARKALRSLCKQVQLVAAVSGRSAADARQMVGLASMEVVGNHGLERWDRANEQVILIEEAAPYLEAARAAVEELEPLLVRFGITPEEKGATVSLHYRNAPNRDMVRDAVYSKIATIAARHDLELFEGRYILELHPPLDVHKGTAITALAEEFKLAGMVFLGDDVTDLNGFRALRDLREAGRLEGAALGVVSDESPADVAKEADFTLEGVPDVERFFRWMLDTLG
jgi:trehalose 6-phosphate phosphatase